MSWVERKIANLGAVVTGKTPSTSTAAYFGGNYQFVTPSDLEYRNYYCRKSGVSVTEEARAKYSNQFVPPDSVMVTCIGNTIGKCALSSETCLTNQQINTIVPNEENDPKFIYYLMNHSVDVIRGIGLGGGAAMPIINKTTFCNVTVRVPRKIVQERIADFLSGYDDLIENNRRRIQLLEQSARLLYKEWFVHLRFPGHEHVKVADGVPKGWERIPLGEVLTLQRGFDLPTQDRLEGHVPIYAATGINGYHKEAKVKGPGIVTGRSGSLGKVKYVLEDFWPLNTTLWVKEFKRVDAPFAYHLLASLRLEKYNGGVAVPTLNRNDVHRIEVVCPAASVIRDFSEQVSAIYDQIDKLKRYAKKLCEARDLLLPRLMSGEIEV